VEKQQSQSLMKKIAAIVPYTFLPAQSGGQKLISGFYNELGKHTSLHVFGTPENDTSLKGNYNLEAVLSSSQFRYADVFSFFRIKKHLKQHSIEYLLIEHPYMGWLGWLLKKTTGVQLIIHTHNIEFKRFRSIGKWWWPLLKMYEKWVLKKADLVFCITDEDRNGFIKELSVAKEKCAVVPYGIPQQTAPADKAEVKASVCKELNIPAETKLLFFNGVLNYTPNHEALNNILEQINPVLLNSSLQYKILIAGKNLPSSYDSLSEWQQQNIIYLGFVDDIDRYTKAADMMLNPVQSGGGVKTKMIEALGMNTTVISAETGAAGVSNDVCGEKLIVVNDNDWAAFTNAILKSVDSNAMIPDAFYRKFSWGGIVGRVISLISKQTKVDPS
jgi:polysaccharide biosynthesis protein PslH